MSNPQPETLYLVDAFSLIFQVFHAIPTMTSPSGEPTNAVFGFTKDMLYLRETKRPTRLLCLFDVAGPTFREKLYTEYKAHRPPMPLDLQPQIGMIQEMLHAMRIPVLGIEGFEADDLMATLAYEGEKMGMDVLICSSDKDCRQLLTDRVKIFNLRKLEVFDQASLLRDWGITPAQVIDYQTMVGDSVDNVPGIEGVGPKTAAKFLQEYGSLDQLLANVDKLAGKKKENVLAAIPSLETSRKLVTLDKHVPMSLDWEGWKIQPWDGPRLLELFRGWGFHRFADQVRQTLGPAAKKPGRIVQGDLFAAEADPAAAGEAKSAWQGTYRAVQTEGELAQLVEQLEVQPRVALRLETLGRGAHAAALVGLSFCWREGEAIYLPLQAAGGESILNGGEALRRLKPLLEAGAPAKVCHNLKLDVQVLRACGIELGAATDVMIADYLLTAGELTHSLSNLAEKHLNHPLEPIVELVGKAKRRIDELPLARRTQLAGEEADVIWRCAEQLAPKLADAGLDQLYAELELPLVRVLADMEHAGVRLDVPLLTRLSQEMGTRLAELEQDIYRLAGESFNIGSVKQLRSILFDKLGYKAEKKTSIMGHASTDQETLEVLAAQGLELPKKLLEHRQIAKLKSTYVDALPALVDAATGRVHGSFNQTIAATGRLSSSDPNLQNIPIRSEMGGQIRQAFLPEPGWLLLAADYSQIELRLLAHFSEDAALQQAFTQGLDIHARVAAQIFNVPEDAVTAEMRRTAKTVNFGVIYGISAFGLAQRLELSKAEAARFIDTYFERYPRVLEYQQRLLAECRRTGYVTTLSGRRRRILGVRARTDYKQRNQPEREAINMEIQGSAADLIKLAMLRIHQALRDARLRSRLLLQIHDELVLEVPDDERAKAAALVREHMLGAYADRLRVPLAIDMGIGPNWLDTAPVG